MLVWLSYYAVSSAICTDTQFDVSPLAKQPAAAAATQLHVECYSFLSGYEPWQERKSQEG